MSDNNGTTLPPSLLSLASLTFTSLASLTFPNADDLSLQEIYLWEVEHLGAHFPSTFTGLNKMKNNTSTYSEYTSEPSSPVSVGDAGSDYNKLIR